MGGLLNEQVTPESYTYNEWDIQESCLQQAEQSQSESVLSVGNGFIGLRGVFEESDASNQQARACLFLNGVYDKAKIDYYEKAHGFASFSDTRIPAADPSKLNIYADGEQFFNSAADKYQRWLDYRSGEVNRVVTWKTKAGKQLELHFKRFASDKHSHLLAMQVSIKAINFSGKLHIDSFLDARFGGTEDTTQDSAVHDPRVSPTIHHNPWEHEANINSEGNIRGFITTLPNSGFRVASACTHTLSCSEAEDYVSHQESYLTKESFTLEIQDQQKIVIEKLVVFIASQTSSTETLNNDTTEALKYASTQGYASLYEEQTERLKQFWQDSQVEIGENPALSSAMRFNMLQLLQSVGRDGRTSLSAKGQTGEGYEGHYFWDAEILGLPFFSFSKPELAKKMLMYRFNGLDKAREIASIMGHKSGALFPWRTISGYECSAFFPAGTAQYHINADISHAVKLYHQASGDDDFIAQAGAEIVWETARVWIDMGFYCQRKNGDFVINGVTGPDEYTAMVNNNFYTNTMAKAHLEYAAKIYKEKLAEDTAENIGLSSEEASAWERAAEKMHLPFDKTLGIHMQDDSFLDKEVWDFENTPAEKYPLLLHYHPLTIYRYQVSKQADTVLALVLEGEEFTTESKLKSYEYYKKVCIHDSTLSPCAYSILACEINKQDEAFDFFTKTVFIDVENLHQNSGHGLHMAAMGGGWMSLVYGFAGMRTHKASLSFNPTLPSDWPSYSFNLNFRGRIIQVSVGRTNTSYTLLRGEPLTLKHKTTTLSLTEHGKPYTVI